MYKLKLGLVLAIHLVTIYHLPLGVNGSKISSDQGSFQQFSASSKYLKKGNEERIDSLDNNPKNLSLNLGNENVLRQTPKLDYATTGVSIATNLVTISLSVYQIFSGQTDLAGLRQLSRKLDTEFAAVKKNVAKIKNQLEEVHCVIPYYQDFELALRNALLDIEFPPPNDLEIFQKRGLYLHDQLRTFLQGMLGTNMVLGDIVATIFKRQVIFSLILFSYLIGDSLSNQEIRTFCDADKIDEDLRPFYDMIKLGAIGLGFYSNKIGRAFNM